jgi:hypothetical protein
VLALGIVPAQMLADQLKPFPVGQAGDVLALACWSTPYIVVALLKVKHFS